MAKSLKETVEWYASSENRKWKRYFQVGELAIEVLIIIVILGTVVFYGDGSGFQGGYLLFSTAILFTYGSFTISFKNNNGLSRFNRMLIIFTGLACAGLIAMAGFQILVSQGGNA